MNNLVSIITPSYNSEKFIANTIASVLAQTYTFWEMIIVDDCSTDNSVKIINSFKDKRIKLITLKENSGAAVARNKAIAKAKGNFIAFLDSDDFWYPNKLEVQINFMVKNNYKLTYTSYQQVDENATPIKKIECHKKLSYQDLLSANRIGCLTAVYAADKLGKIYMPTIRKRQDYAFWLSILKKIDYAYGIQQVLANYTIRNQSISNNK